jgi:hypothetical protein
MALSDHVTLTITNGTVGVARAGYGIPMILSVNAAWTSDRARVYTGIEGVAADFATTSPEYLAANELFSQEPHPEQVIIGRAVGKPTQRYKVTASIVENTHTYKLLVKGQGVTETTVTYTSDGTATDAEIAAGLVTALNAVVGKNYTATGGASPVAVTGNAPGNWFSIESLEPTYLKIEQDHAEPATTIATDIAAIRASGSLGDSWYALYTLYNSDAYVKAAAAAIEPLNKIYAADLPNSDSANLADGGGDTGDALQALNYNRTFTTYSPSPASMAGAAFLGTRLPYEPGPATWKFAQPNALSAVNVTDTQAANLVAKNINFLQTTAGVDSFREGVMVGGEFIDKIRNLDWLRDDVTKSVYETLLSNLAVPFTPLGISMIEAAIRGSLQRAVDRQIIDADFKIVVPTIAQTASSDRAIRKLTGVKFSCRMQGAVHKVNITGVVSV